MGEWKDKVEGKVKETVGGATGDDSMETEGKAQNTWGNAQGTLNQAKDTAESAVGTLTSDNDTDGTDDTDSNT